MYFSLQLLILIFQFLRISSNDEASVTALFNLYNEYINKEKQRAYDPYEVTLSLLHTYFVAS